jgi:D-mannonate dehydratase
MNVIHSIDGYIVRTMHRKCNYDSVVVQNAYQAICNAIGQAKSKASNQVQYYIDQYERSTVADVVVLPYIMENATALSDKHLEKLKALCEQMLKHKPFPIVTIHDQFNCHAGNVDQMRYHYKETLADLADSEILSDIFSQIYGIKLTYQKLSNDLGNKIRESEYAIC